MTQRKRRIMMSAMLLILFKDRGPALWINPDDWPVLVEAPVYEQDGRGEGRRVWRLVVRGHADGRALVYGTLSFEPEWREESYHGPYGAEEVPPGGDVAAAVHRVGAWLADVFCLTSDKWDRATLGCLARLPAALSAASPAGGQDRQALSADRQALSAALPAATPAALPAVSADRQAGRQGGQGRQDRQAVPAALPVALSADRQGRHGRQDRQGRQGRQGVQS
jgi:hypothetical protein